VQEDERKRDRTVFEQRDLRGRIKYLSNTRGGHEHLTGSRVGDLVRLVWHKKKGIHGQRLHAHGAAREGLMVRLG